MHAVPKSRISHLDTLKYLLTKSYRTTLYTKQGRSDKPEQKEVLFNLRINQLDVSKIVR